MTPFHKAPIGTNPLPILIQTSGLRIFTNQEGFNNQLIAFKDKGKLSYKE